VLLVTAACDGGDDPGSILPQRSTQEARILQAVAQLDEIVPDMMERSGIPGLAVAVVRGDEVLYAKGFGVRRVGSPEKVDADTVFAIASMSKPLGATVVASQVSLGEVSWETPMSEVFPGFALSDPAATKQVTVGDLYAHRSGLPDHAGDTLEELNFNRETILSRFHRLPAAPFRQEFNYTNYGMTAAAVAVAEQAGTDWPSLAERSLYQPLKMDSTSSRFADFLARSNRAPGHVKENGVFVVGPERPPGTGEQRWSTGWNTDQQSPSGGVSSSAADLARWMSFVLASINRTSLLSEEAFTPAITPQFTLYQAKNDQETSVSYGYGFFIDDLPTGERILHHGGAFSWGTGTNVSLLPSADLGIVVLTNAWPTGVSEALCGRFMETVRLGAPQKDWYAYYAGALATAYDPQGELAGLPRPDQPVLARPLQDYLGSYQSPYHGTASVVTGSQGLELRLGPQGEVVFKLDHWDGDIFTFIPFNDATGPGSLSKAEFSGDTLVLEHYNNPKSNLQGLGVFTR